MLQPSHLTLADGTRLAYHKIAGRSPTIVFCHGFHADMQGEKIKALAQYCRTQGHGFLAFDHFGHGTSSGEFKEGTIGRWKDDALAVVDHLVEGPIVLVGSSMGGWISLLVALNRMERVAGFIGIASAPDFIARHICKNLSEAHQLALKTQGYFLRPSSYGEPYPITQTLLEEARAHLLMDAPIPLRIPVHLIHGMRDADIPWQTSCELAEKIISPQVRVSLLKTGDHRLSTSEDIAFICQAVEEMVRDWA